MARNSRAYALALAIVATGSATRVAAAPVLSPIWTDNAVIQRDQPILLNGRAKPNEPLRIALGNQVLAVTAGPDGHFSARLAPLPASAVPLALTVSDSSGERVHVTGLLVGDVWFCSGQSNMEMTVERALDAGNLIPASRDDQLRMMTIPKATDSRPRDHFAGPVAWQSADSGTTGSFSAACYFMGRELRRQNRVPIGLIHASWGGSASRPWLSPGGARAIYPARDLAMLAQQQTDPVGAITQFAPTWQDWYLRESGGQDVWASPDRISWADVPGMVDWQQWGDPGLAEHPTGLVWLRRTLNLTAEQARGDAVLTLGAVDDMDMTWINGRAIGNSYGWDSDRSYRIPASYLRAGRNEIIIAAINSWGAGGFVSGGSQFAFHPARGERVGLERGWRYSRSAVAGFPPRSPWDRQAGIGVMYNAMVAPIGPFAARGVAWYQGESDVGTPGYSGRLAALFRGWREQFGTDARILVVQLANFGAPQSRPGYSGWAELREEQRKGVRADGNAALVTAIDLGDRTDVHPANKNELGRRLAMAAMGLSLPQPESARRDGNAIRIGFQGVEGALSAWSSGAPIGFELCGAAPDSCRYATARIDGSTIVLPGDGQPIFRVRYAWSDNPVVNLYDSRMLPVPGFELDVIG